LYGYRIDGPHDPRLGHRCSDKAVLVDPYAKALSGAHPWGAPHKPRRGRIVIDDFDWQDDVAPRTPLARSILSELHVRGYTRHPSANVRHPGPFLGLCVKIPHLKSLGVTAVQLMPVVEFDELDQTHKNPHTGEQLRNYWGYSPLSFFAPKGAFAVRAGQ